jgi:hypothetical protein
MLCHQVIDFIFELTVLGIGSGELVLAVLTGLHENVDVSLDFVYLFGLSP